MTNIRNLFTSSMTSSDLNIPKRETDCVLYEKCVSLGIANDTCQAGSKITARQPCKYAMVKLLFDISEKLDKANH